jgi:N utilization substance protein A
MLGEANIDETAANEIIMAARAHWFDDEPAEAEAPESDISEADIKED